MLTAHAIEAQAHQIASDEIVERAKQIMRIVPRIARTRTGGGVGKAAAARRRGTDILALTILRAIRFRRYPRNSHNTREQPLSLCQKTNRSLYLS